ncbi:serine hydrolase domain-containing protein [Anaerocolumna sp. MB42-C2]|uniref:serine hydrolase domain-containing protein n=1 Tax=Anaerocolumna sp. MB42-C2 TaxID=3070997 RepID=UPI0027E165C3|nr:serine hydrolase domain-containing protein [Anaerocolumna sp. MB42-C2]WMJ90076.1 serine hydrolase domain-containing protein [Anaerocolumna sp. MB42-C2]
MVIKLVKAGLSIVLALTITLVPNTYVSAKAMNHLPQSQSDITLTSFPQAEKTALSQDTTDPAPSDTSTPVKKLAKDKAATLTTLYGATSVQYALLEDGNITVSGFSGVYSKDTSTPLTDTNMYGIGSISKMFTTVAVMQLAEEGKVDLDTPVIEYIPEFTMSDPRYKDITVRMLINHSSGLMGSTLGNAVLFNDKDNTAYKNLLNTLKTSRLKADPGEFSVYCNDGFTMAELLVEKVSGESFTDYMKEHISAPLNLYNTKTPQDNFEQERLVKTYIPGSSTTLPTETLNMIGAGGIYSSASNLCQFARIFMNDSNSFVLNNSSAKSMENKEYLNGLWSEDKSSTINYGLGWDSVITYPFDKYNIKALSKGGDTLFYHGNLTVLPEKNMAVAVLSSGGSSMYDQVMAQEILLAALKAKGDIDGILPDVTYAKPVKSEMPENLKQYAGIYGSYGGTYKIAISDDGTLTFSNLTTPAAPAQKFIYTGDGRFYFSDGSTYVSFENGKNGIIYLNVSGYVALPGLGQTVTDGYQAQKLTDNPISQELKAVWEKRNGKYYFLVNEKYDSEYYTAGSLYSKISLLNELEGYCLYAKIIDQNTARAVLEIPGVFGRDLSDFVFYQDNGCEYLKAESSVLISEDEIKTMPASAFKVGITSNGYAKWYKIGKKSANKKLKIALPQNASFCVYDSNNSCIMDSYITKKDTVTLPKNGYIVFAGDVNSKFHINYIK